MFEALINFFAAVNEWLTPPVTDECCDDELATSIPPSEDFDFVRMTNADDMEFIKAYSEAHPVELAKLSLWDGTELLFMDDGLPVHDGKWSEIIVTNADGAFVDEELVTDFQRLVATYFLRKTRTMHPEFQKLFASEEVEREAPFADKRTQQEKNIPSCRAKPEKHPAVQAPSTKEEALRKLEDEFLEKHSLTPDAVTNDTPPKKCRPTKPEPCAFSEVADNNYENAVSAVEDLLLKAFPLMPPTASREDLPTVSEAVQTILEAVDFMCETEDVEDTGEYDDGNGATIGAPLRNIIAEGIIKAVETPPQEDEAQFTREVAAQLSDLFSQCLNNPQAIRSKIAHPSHASREQDKEDVKHDCREKQEGERDSVYRCSRTHTPEHMSKPEHFKQVEREEIRVPIDGFKLPEHAKKADETMMPFANLSDDELPGAVLKEWQRIKDAQQKVEGKEKDEANDSEHQLRQNHPKFGPICTCGVVLNAIPVTLEEHQADPTRGIFTA